MRITYFILLLLLSHPYQWLIAQNDIFLAVESGDTIALNKYIDEGGDLNLKIEKQTDIEDLTVTVSMLQLAAGRNQSAIADILIRNKEKIKNWQQYLNEALPVAVLAVNEDLVQKLLTVGADINYPCEECHGKTAVMIALQYKNYSLFHYMLEQGADINVADTSGNTLLHIAASYIYDNKAITQLLINEGLDVNQQNYFGTTALMYAALEGSFEVFNLLMENKADLFLEDEEGDGILSYALEGKDPDILRFLLDIDWGGKFTPLFQTISDYNPEGMSLLIELDADVNKKNYWGESPLHEAVFSNKVELLPILLKAGAKVDEKNNEGNTPLHLAVVPSILSDPLELVPMLLEAGADVDEKNNKGNTPLHIAVSYGEWEVTTLLLEYGANINEADNEGQTVLHKAIINEQDKDLVKNLLKSGADKKIADNEGKTALHYALERGDREIIKLLKK